MCCRAVCTHDYTLDLYQFQIKKNVTHFPIFAEFVALKKAGYMATKTWGTCSSVVKVLTRVTEPKARAFDPATYLHCVFAHSSASD